MKNNKNSYTGFLSLYKVITKYHGTIYVHGFNNKEVYDKVCAFIVKTPLYNNLKEKCFNDMDIIKDESYNFVII